MFSRLEAELIQRWVSITFTPQLSLLLFSTRRRYIDWDKLQKGIAGVKEAFHQQAAGRSLDVNKVTTLQDNLDQLIPESCCPWFDFPLHVPS